MRSRCDNGIVNAGPFQHVTTNPAVNIIDASQNKRAFPQYTVIPRKQPALTLFGAEGKAPGKKPFLETPTKDEGGNEEPPEPANVPKPPTDPDDELEGAEEIPDGAEEIVDEDGNTTVQYTYSTDFDKWWKSLPKEERNQKKNNIDLMEPEGAR